MDLKEKELLLKDLCARLPYEVIVNIEYSKEHGSSYRLRVCSEGDLKLNTDLLGLFIQEKIYLKPYLRPMSSMTEEERAELYKVGGLMSHKVETDIYVLTAFSPEAYDWLNAHHFDYRGLLEKGLSLEAKEGMY